MDLKIFLKMTIEGDFPHEIVARTLQNVNDAYYLTELMDLKAFRKEFDQIPKVVFDAVEHRIKEYRRSAVVIQKAEDGSLEFYIAITALLIWLLKITIGETIKEAWLASDLHIKIKDFLTKRWLVKRDRFVDEARKKLSKDIPGDLTIDIKGKNNHLENDSNDYTIHININVKPLKEYPPKMKKMLDDLAQ